MSTLAPRVLLIVTNREDLAADYLITRLIERELPYYRLNAEDAWSTRVDVSIDAHETVRRLQMAEATIDLKEVACVWYRRAVRPIAHPVTAPEFRAFAANELRHLFEGLILGSGSASGVRWVNPLPQTEAAERKIYQLQLAIRSGFLVPETIVCDDPTTLARFVEKHGSVICKPISQGLVDTGEKCFAVYTREVSAADVAESPSLGGLPVMAQRLVPKGTDIRVTMIGGDAYAVEVGAPVGSPVDWRATKAGLSYRVCTMPREVETAAHSLMAALGIVYGAFDFIRTDAGDWVFLEVNPAGEWAWLEAELGLPMRDSFIRLFYDN